MWSVWQGRGGEIKAVKCDWAQWPVSVTRRLQETALKPGHVCRRSACLLNTKPPILRFRFVEQSFPVGKLGGDKKCGPSCVPRGPVWETLDESSNLAWHYGLHWKALTQSHQGGHGIEGKSVFRNLYATINLSKRMVLPACGMTMYLSLFPHLPRAFPSSWDTPLSAPADT